MNIKDIGKYLNSQYQGTFERLVREYFKECHGMPVVSLDSSTYLNYEVLRYPHKTQFVSNITKEVLFEVGIEVPEYMSCSKKEFCVWYNVFWK
tara:strand:+ start:2036 stop:2314 length:279 start_codon:yes stop_codon:yes gene_type:complete